MPVVSTRRPLKRMRTNWVRLSALTVAAFAQHAGGAIGPLALGPGHGLTVRSHRGLMRVEVHDDRVPGDLPPGLQQALRQGWVEHLGLRVTESNCEGLLADPLLACVPRLELQGPALGL